MDIRNFGCITFIPGQNNSRYPNCNSLFIDDEVKAIIDPGSDDKILTDLLSRGVGVLINSHCHEDHTSYNYLFEKSQLWVHEREASCYSSFASLMEYYGMSDNPHYRLWHDLLVGRMNYRERATDREFTHGDILDFGKTRLQVIHTPGHSAGHCCFYFPDEGVLFLADLDLTPFGPWYGDRFSDIEQTRSSMEGLLKIPADIYITSHEAGIIEGDITGMVDQYLEAIDRRERKLIEFLEQPRTMDEIVESWIIYGKERSPRYFFEYGERGMIGKHLERLIGQGRAQKISERYNLV